MLPRLAMLYYYSVFRFYTSVFRRFPFAHVYPHFTPFTHILPHFVPVTVFYPVSDTHVFPQLSVISTHVLICVKEATLLVGYCSWMNSMPKIRASYMQALKLNLVFASLLFEAERNLETPDSSVFVDQVVGAFPRNRRTPYILMFLRTG